MPSGGFLQATAKATLVLALTALAACGDGWITMPDSNTDSRILHLMEDDRRPDPRYPELTSYQHATVEERFHAAAFIYLDGLSAAQAIAAMAADGFTCTGLTCNTRIRERETFIAKYGIRAPGPLRDFTYDYTITLLAPTIIAPSDLTTNVHFSSTNRTQTPPI